MEEIFRRASIRRFQDRPVEMEKAELLFRAAMAAPSAANQRPLGVLRRHAPGHAGGAEPLLPLLELSRRGSPWHSGLLSQELPLPPPRAH